jgi:hypothetical protein
MKNNQSKSSRGGKRLGAGRPKGAPNKVTADVRQAFAELLEGATPKLEKWLDRVAKKSPARALDIVTRMAEYHIPKLAKSEHKLAGAAEVRVVNMTGVRVNSGNRENPYEDGGGVPTSPPRL